MIHTRIRTKAKNYLGIDCVPCFTRVNGPMIHAIISKTGVIILRAPKSPKVPFFTSTKDLEPREKQSYRELALGDEIVLSNVECRNVNDT